MGSKQSVGCPYRAAAPMTTDKVGWPRAGCRLPRRALCSYPFLVAVTKVQRNDIFRAVAAGGLAHSECEFSYQGNHAGLRHKRSESYLSIGGDGHGHYMVFLKVGDDEQESRTAGDWSSVLPYVEQWASDVRRYAEIDAQIPDLWAELLQGGKFLTDVQNSNTENTPFDPDELAEISRLLRGIKDRAQQAYSLMR